MDVGITISVAKTYLIKHSVTLSFQICLCGLWNMTYFRLYSSLPQRRNISRLSLFYDYFYGKCSGEFDTLHSPVQIFIAKTRLATPKSWITRSLSALHSENVFPRLCGRDTRVQIVPDATTIIPSSQRSVVTYPLYTVIPHAYYGFIHNTHH